MDILHIIINHIGLHDDEVHEARMAVQDAVAFGSSRDCLTRFRDVEPPAEFWNFAIRIHGAGAYGVYAAVRG